MALQITQLQADLICQHSAREYPNECCGALLGTVSGARKEVREVVPLTNLRQDPDRGQEILPVKDLATETTRNRFLIDPLEQLRVEKDARRRGLEVLGYYHSHPDQPARPSTHDRENAWPWYSYLIVSVERGAPKELASWVLAEDRSRFHAEPLHVS